MLTRLFKHRCELNAAHAELEQRVTLRTTELEAKRREAEAARRELQQVIDLSLDVLMLTDSDDIGVMVSPARRRIAARHTSKHIV